MKPYKYKTHNSLLDTLEDLLNDEPWIYLGIGCLFILSVAALTIVSIVDKTFPPLETVGTVFIIPIFGLIIYAFRNRGNVVVHPAFRYLGWIVFGLWVLHWFVRV